MGATYLRFSASLVVFCAILTGCDNLVPGPSRSASERPDDFSSTLVTGATVQGARAAATQVLKEHFRFDAETSTATVVRSQWKDMAVHADDETPRVREVLSGRSGRRRASAAIELVERGPDVLVWCQVQLQRLEAPERTAFASQRGGDDRPAAKSAAERGMVVEPRSRDQWVNVGRDRQLEHTMLNQIADRLGGTASTRPTVTASQPRVP